jgi:hypothetical protein
VLPFEKGAAMNEIIGEEKIWREWMYAPAKWSDLLEKKRHWLPEMNEIVYRILDSSGECIPEIFEEYPTDLKLLLIGVFCTCKL